MLINGSSESQKHGVRAQAYIVYVMCMSEALLFNTCGGNTGCTSLSMRCGTPLTVAAEQSMVSGLFPSVNKACLRRLLPWPTQHGTPWHSMAQQDLAMLLGPKGKHASV